MNLHLALKTIWTVETDAGPLRLRLKHFKPKKKTKGFTASSIFTYTQKTVLHASEERGKKRSGYSFTSAAWTLDLCKESQP